MKKILIALLLAGSALGASVVNDVTQINPTTVAQEIAPTSVEEIQKLLRESKGPVSIGGGRFSMGGQTASPDSVHIDMRKMDRVLKLDKEHHEVTVQAGITWRKLQEILDPQDLSVDIMQSYSNFTVGGSLSVNVHGRYVGKGPLIGSVKSLKIVTANGDVKTVSPKQESQLFYGAIGGYGGIGVIVEATLNVVPNTRIERLHTTMPVTDYYAFFKSKVRDNPDAVFHNGDIYPAAYETVGAITWQKTDKPVTVPERLMTIQPLTSSELWRLSLLSNWRVGKWLRQNISDPLEYRKNPVVWRNHEASYDVSSLEPASRADSTYVLQEYFVPVAKFDEFVPILRRVFQTNDVNVLNVSIRHAIKDPGSLMAWAREEVFAFVVYYKQDTSLDAQQKVKKWTREIIDGVLSVDGTYYLPYQLHATQDQFEKAYPRFKEYVALKEKKDPSFRFRNRLWNQYYKRRTDPEPDLLAKARATPDYRRSEDQTFLTLAEWFIVSNSDEYAERLKTAKPGSFGFFRGVWDFWRVYAASIGQTWSRYPFNWQYHTMIAVIGVSFTVENVVKGVYEKTLGFAAGIFSSPLSTAEDRFVAATAKDYADFIHQTPWYRYPFWSKLKEFWSNSDTGGNWIRRVERRIFFSAELMAKALWGKTLGWLTGATTEAVVLKTGAVLRVASPKDREAAWQLQWLPRYGGFKTEALKLADAGGEFADVAGNERVALSLVTPNEWKGLSHRGEPVVSWPLLDGSDRRRVVTAIWVSQLSERLKEFRDEGILEHVYDY